MTEYFEIYPIADTKHDIFDTIDYVGYKTGKTFNQMLDALGYGSIGNLRAYITKMSLDYNYFSIERRVTDQLNAFLRARKIPLRISARAAIRKVNYGRGTGVSY